ncbi:MAG: hypothetical protein SO123_03395, partial [Eubacteriales bacterium]|nr:hypothetical protein [Eubacteriales bacterium]
RDLKSLGVTSVPVRVRFSAPAKDDAFLRRLLLSRNTVDKEPHRFAVAFGGCLQTLALCSVYVKQ